MLVNSQRFLYSTYRSMNLPSLDQQEYIENIISTRLCSSIEYSHVLRWLSNFDDSDQNLAIEILSKIDYYSYDRMLSVIQNNIDRILPDSSRRCVFLPIGEPGKSGGSILYLCQQVQKDKSVYVNNIEEALSFLRNPNHILVFVDDIIGSGNTFCNWLKGKVNTVGLGDQLKELIDQSRIKLISIAVLEYGKNKINSEYPQIEVLGEYTHKLFLKSGSIFGGYIKMKRMREFCYKYGIMVYRQCPLGYQNSQVLIVFSHTTPNNTLPIVWSNSNINGRRASWYPLFPRFAQQRVARGKETRQDKRRELVLFRELFGYEKVEKDLFKNRNLDLLQIIKLRLRRSDDLTIRQALGVPQDYLSELLDLGLSKGLWDEQWNLTELCIDKYKELEKKIKFNKTARKEEELETSSYLEEEILYIPETFKGVK